MKYQKFLLKLEDLFFIFLVIGLILMLYTYFQNINPIFYQNLEAFIIGLYFLIWLTNGAYHVQQMKKRFSKYLEWNGELTLTEKLLIIITLILFLSVMIYIAIIKKQVSLNDYEVTNRAIQQMFNNSRLLQGGF